MNLEFFFDFVSPYAYLASQRIEELCARHGCTLTWTPVLFAALLNHSGQLGPAEIPAKRRFMLRNLQRLAHDHGIPLRFPPAHPFNPLQPLRSVCLEPSAARIHELFRTCWAEGQEIDRLGSISDPETARRTLQNNTARAIELGVFGVPTMRVGEELFWGFDSFPDLERFLAGKDPLDLAELRRWEQLPVAAARKAAERER